MIMTFQYNPYNEALFAALCWALIAAGLLLSVLMAYDVRHVMNVEFRGAP